MRPPPDKLKATGRAALLAAALVAVPLADVGCADHDRVGRRYDDGDAPPPVSVVTTYSSAAPAKPLPRADASDGLPPLYNDPAIVRQQVPEEPRYVRAYDNIGKPKLIVFVNRTVTGELVPVEPAVPMGLPRYDDRTGTYLRPGQYDQAQASNIDYELIENLLTEDLAAGGQVAMIAPLSARQRLGDDEVRDIQAGRPQMLGELATKLNADVLVQVTARPSVQTDQGLGIRLVAEALNTHGGQAVAFADVDVPPPLTRPRLNEYVRFVSRKLMDGMSGSWEAMAAAPFATVPPAATVQPAARNPMTGEPLGSADVPPAHQAPTEVVVPNPITNPAPATMPAPPTPPGASQPAARPSTGTPGDLPPPP